MLRPKGFISRYLSPVLGPVYFMDYLRYVSKVYCSRYTLSCSQSHHISKFIVHLFRAISISPFSISDMFSFIQHLFRINVNCTSDVVMASLNMIFLLFTNISLINLTFKFYPQFSELVIMSVKNCQFNGNFCG